MRPSFRLDAVRRASTAVAVVVTLAACTGTTPSGMPESSDTTAAEATTAAGTATAGTRDDPAARIAAIEVARTAAEPAVAELTAASGTLVALFEAWQDEPDRVDLAVEVAGMQERLGAAVAGARDSLDPSTSVDVATAAAAMGEAADIVADQSATASAVAADVALTARVAELAARFTREINEPGSRSVQRNAMEAVIADLDALQADLVAAVPTAACPGVLAPRVEAVAHMAEVAADLASMATNGQGDAFDALRATATGDPFGRGTTDLDTVAAAVDCEAVAGVVGVGPSLEAALAEVQAALNPADLVS